MSGDAGPLRPGWVASPPPAPSSSESTVSGCPVATCPAALAARSEGMSDTLRPAQLAATPGTSVSLATADVTRSPILSPTKWLTGAATAPPTAPAAAAVPVELQSKPSSRCPSASSIPCAAASVPAPKAVPTTAPTPTLTATPATRSPRNTAPLATSLLINCCVAFVTAALAATIAPASAACPTPGINAQAKLASRETAVM